MNKMIPIERARKIIPKMKNPKIIIIDEATNKIIFNPSKYEILKVQVMQKEK